MHFEIQSQHYYKNQLDKRFINSDIPQRLKDLLESSLNDPDAFNAEQFEEFSLEEIFIYLKASHQFYLDVWIPKIENTLLQMRSKFGNEYWSVRLLLLFVNSYKKELLEHIEQEEQVLFSFVEKMLRNEQCSGHQDLVLNHFIHTHNDNIIIQLEELRNDILTFDEDLQGNLFFEVLFNQLSVFQRDLMIHGLIEDQVFIGKVVEFANRD